MKTLVVFLILISAASAQNLVFINRTATFTNLEGQSFIGVNLVKADLDGVIWMKESSGGRICYTNLNPQLLESWGIPSNRIDVARARAEQKAVADAAYRRRGVYEGQKAEAARNEGLAREAAVAEESAEQREKDAAAEQIRLFEAQIEAAQTTLRRNSAAAYDYNQANAFNVNAPILYTRETDQVKIDEARARLEKMKDEFNAKYHPKD